MYAWHANFNTIRNNKFKTRESLGKKSKKDRLDERPKTIVFFILFYFCLKTLKRVDVWHSIEIELIGWTWTSENNNNATFSDGRTIVCPKLYFHLE